jgi:hypothetical protein
MILNRSGTSIQIFVEHQMFYYYYYSVTGINFDIVNKIFVIINTGLTTLGKNKVT